MDPTIEENPIELHTARLFLREMSLRVATSVAADGDGRLAWLGGTPPDGTRVAARLRVEATDAGRYRTGWGPYVITVAESALAVGAIGFHAAPVEGRAEVGYDLLAAARGHGYATEALVALAGWGLAQAGTATIIARTRVDNSASQRVLLRAGFALVDADESDFSYELIR